MRSLLYFFAFSMYFFTGISAANATRTDSQLAPNKDFYTIYPKNGTDTSKTGDYIKNIVGTDDIQPWTNLQQQLISWTVEASTSEVGQLQSYGDIESVVLFNPPAPPVRSNFSSSSETTTRALTSDEPLVKRDDAGNEVVGYIIYPRDGTNKAATDWTNKNLQQICGSLYEGPGHVFNGAVRRWSVGLITAAQLDEVKKDSGVRLVEENLALELGLIPDTFHSRDFSPQSMPNAKISNSKNKRAISYSTQLDAVPELISVSQPTSVPNLNDLKNYVYESHGGKDSFVYHLEMGVAFQDQPDEFPKTSRVPDGEHLQTTLAEFQGDKVWEDRSPAPKDSHATCTATKAVGQKYGVAKQAKLVVVQMHKLEYSEMIDALEKIIDDINDKNRQKKSVVTMSFTGGKEIQNSEDQTEIKDKIKTLMDMDVPVLVIAGNYANKGRPRVDTIPGVWANKDYPLLVIGSTNPDGKISKFSQVSDQVFLYATGTGVTCMPKSGDDPMTNQQGTSVACPVVAGEIANLLSYDQPPFDTTDKKLVRSLWDYYKTGAGAWARQDQTRVIWNGVTEQDNPKVQPPAPPAPAPTSNPAQPTVAAAPQCTGLANKKYVAADDLKDRIEKDFCPAAAKQGALDTGSGSLGRAYNGGTPESVIISMAWAPGLDFKPNLDDCKKYLTAISDDCDGNDPQNPENYKAGGSMKVGDVTYHIAPQSLRQPASDGLKGSCNCKYKALYDECEIWGHGFSSGDYGDNLKGNLGGCALLPETWDFEYGLGDDGREWTAKFRTGVFQNHCVGDATASNGAPPHFDCGGSG